MKKQKQSMTKRVMGMVEQGFSNKQIIARLHCNPQIIYNARYRINKQKGLGALPTATYQIPVPPSTLPRVDPFPPAFHAGNRQMPTPTLWMRIKAFFRRMFGWA